MIFLDADAPDYHAPDQIALFRHEAATRRAPIYVMTGVSEDARMQHVAGVLHKPFTIHEMTDIIWKAKHVDDESRPVPAS